MLAAARSRTQLLWRAALPKRSLVAQARLLHCSSGVLSRSSVGFADVGRFKTVSSPADSESSTPRVGDDVASDTGLSRFMARVHATSAAAFGGSLAAASALNWAMPAGFFAAQYPLQTLGVSLVGAIGSLVWFYKAPYTVSTTYEQPGGAESGSTLRELGSSTRSPAIRSAGALSGDRPVPIYTAVYSTSRKAAFASFLAFETLVLLPMVDMANQINGLLVPGAAGITALVMGGASLYAYQAKPTHMAAWEAPLAGGLLALLGMNLAGVGSYWLMGPNAFTAAVFSAEPYVGIALFTAITASDTYQAIEAYKRKQPDHLEAAVQLYLNAINIFLRVLRLMAEARK